MEKFLRVSMVSMVMVGVFMVVNSYAVQHAWVYDKDQKKSVWTEVYKSEPSVPKSTTFSDMNKAYENRQALIAAAPSSEKFTLPSGKTAVDFNGDGKFQSSEISGLSKGGKGSYKTVAGDSISKTFGSISLASNLKSANSNSGKAGTANGFKSAPLATTTLNKAKNAGFKF
jgi:hypothetical protein